MIARYLEHKGVSDVSVVGGTGDKGADIVGSYNQKRWLVQAKYRSSGTTPRDAIEEAYNASWHYDADVLITATNQKFTSGAINYRQELQDQGFDMRLWNKTRFFLLKVYSLLTLY